MDLAGRCEHVVARGEDDVGLRLLVGADAPVDANFAGENVRLLAARMPMTLGAPALLHPNQEGQTPVGMGAQDTDFHARRAPHEDT